MVTTWPIYNAKWQSTTVTCSDGPTCGTAYPSNWDTDDGTVCSSYSHQYYNSSPEPGEEGYKTPSIREFLRRTPKHILKHPRIELAMISRVVDRERSMAAFAKLPLPIRNNKKKHKEFFNRNAMVRVFCEN